MREAASQEACVFWKEEKSRIKKTQNKRKENRDNGKEERRRMEMGKTM